MIFVSCLLKWEWVIIWQGWYWKYFHQPHEGYGRCCWTWPQVITGREGTLDWKLHCYLLKFLKTTLFYAFAWKFFVFEFWLVGTKIGRFIFLNNNLNLQKDNFVDRHWVWISISRLLSYPSMKPSYWMINSPSEKVFDTELYKSQYTYKKSLSEDIHRNVLR